MPVRLSSFRTLQSVLLTSVSALALLGSGAPGRAMQLGTMRGGTFSATTTAMTNAVTNAQQSTTMAQQSMTALRQAVQAVQLSMQQAQAQARAVAQQTPSGVPNGLIPGGLQVAPGVALGSSLWQNANLPVQSFANGATNVTIQQNAPQAILTWQTFNVGQNTTLKFNQQGNTNWVALNRVIDPSGQPSQILGQIKADGQVYVINHNGIVFGGASQINVGALVASTAAITDSQFLNNGLYSTQTGSTYNPSFTNAGGSIVVDQGAEIVTPTPTSVTSGGGFVLLMGTQVTNAGTITTPDGQTELAAGDNFILRQGYGTTSNSWSTTRGNEIAVELNQQGSSLTGGSGTVANTGYIEADTGDITLAGETVEQGGVALSTTSVDVRGTIHLLSSASDPKSSVTLTSGSLTFIDLDSSSATALNSQRSGLLTDSATQDSNRPTDTSIQSGHPFDDLSSLADLEDESRIEITSGGTVWFQNGSQTVAQGGQIAVSAINRVQADTGALLDVAGDQIVLPISANDIAVNVQGNELRDDPNNRDTSILFSDTVYVDERQLTFVPAGTGGDASPRYYTPGGVFEVSGWLNNVGHTIGEWLTIGGSITLSTGSSGGVVAQSGAVFDIAGGSVTYQSGYVQQSYLIGPGGVLYNANSAPADLNYSGIYDGFVVRHNAGGQPDAALTQYFESPFRQSRLYEQGYTVGRDAGSLVLSTPTAIFDGTIDAEVIEGQYQDTARPATVTDPYLLTQATVPLQGQLDLGQYSSIGLINGYGTAVTFGTPSSTPASLVTSIAPLPASAVNTANFDAGQISDENLGGLSIATAGSIAVNAPLSFAPGAQIELIAANTDIAANITAPGGSIKIGNILTPAQSAASTASAIPIAFTDSNGLAQAVLEQGVTLDTQGLWTNGSLDQAFAVGDAFVNGGNVTIDESQGVSLAQGSTINVSSGAAILPNGTLLGGTGGNVALIADDPSAGGTSAATLSLGGAIEALGVNGGGTFKLAASEVLIGSAGTATAPGQVLLTPDFFASGFSNYNITGNSSVAVSDGTSVSVVEPVYQVTSVPFGAPTGSDPSTILSAWLPPLFMEDPVHAKLVQRAGASLTLNSALNAGTAGVTGGTLTVGPGAALDVDPGQSIRLEALGQITVDGTLTAHGGKISIVNDHTAEIPPVTDSTGNFETGALSIWIGGDALLDVSGQSYLARDIDGRPYGDVLNGGSITLGASAGPTTFDTNGVVPSTDAFIIIRPGAVLDASGTQATIDLAAGTSSRTPSQLVNQTTNGGSIALSSYDGIYADGTMEAAGGGPSAVGGTLSVILETPSYPPHIGFANSVVPDDLRVPRVITITQSDGTPQLAADLAPGVTDASLTAGSANFSADDIAAGGFDNVSLFARAAIVFDGNVNLKAGQSIAFYEGALGDTSPNASVTIAAPYVLLDGSTGVDNANARYYPGLGAPTQQTGTGTLTVAADLIDIQNIVQLGTSGTLGLSSGASVAYDYAGFAEADFVSQGDIRFTTPTVTTSGSGTMTALDSIGNVVFTAAQLYPTTGTIAAVVAGYPRGVYGGTLSPTGVITIDSIDGVTPDVPFSAFGSLGFYATTINQGGVVRAPLGKLIFGGNAPGIASSLLDTTAAVDFLPGSITSVSANGLNMPYGGTTDGTTYTYNGATVTFPTTPVDNNANPTTGITISAISVSEAAGATLDLSGGGTLDGAGFVTGSGGSVNALSTPLVNADPANKWFSAANDGVYAIVPGYSGNYAPRNAENGAGDPTPGEQITIAAGVPGLPAGTYTLLPSNYALLPGAFRVEIGGAVTAATAQGSLSNGSYLTSGTISIANTAIHNAVPDTLLLTPAKAVRTYSSYNETSYSQFAVNQAAVLDQLRPILPVDAKVLALFFADGSSAQVPALTIDGSVLFQPAAGGLGGQAVVNGPFTGNLEIVAAAPTAGFSGISLRASDLDALGASRLMIGGALSGGDGYAIVSPVGPQAGSVTLQDGAILSAAEVFLIATQQIEVASGAEIDTIGKGAPPFDSTGGYVYEPTSTSMLVVSNGILDIGGNIAGQASITIDPGAKIYSQGTIGFATAANVTVDPTASLGTAYLDLSVSTLNLGDPGVMAGAAVPAGMLLSQARLDQLLKGDISTGAPALQGLILGASQSLNIFGTVDLSVVNPATGKADLALTLNTPAIYGYGTAADVATLNVGSLYWNGVSEQSAGQVAYVSAPPPAVAINGPGSGAGTLDIIANQIVFGIAPAAIPIASTAPTVDRLISGFSTVNLQAAEISANGNQALSVYQAPGATYGTAGTGGVLNLVTPLVTGAAGSVMSYTAGGALNIAPQAGAAAATATSNALGAEIDLTADTINIAASVLLPSGKLTATATNDINLDAGARLDLAGQAVQMNDVTEYSWGGDVSLSSTSGSVSMAPTATVDVSAVNNNAGSMSFSAASGDVSLNGQLIGAGTGDYSGGSFSVTGQSIGDFAALNAMLDSGQIFGARSFDIKQGDLTVDDTVKAHSVGISIDNGSLTVNGTIDASGTTPGTIRLAAKNDLTLGSTSLLDAHGTVLQVDSYGEPIDAKNKATIELTATSGTLILAGGSAMDLSAPDGVARGEIDLNASRTDETSGDININASGPLNIKGAASIAVNAFWTYFPTDAIGTIVQDNGDTNPVAATGADAGFVGLNQIDARSQQFINAAYNNNVAAGVLSPGLQGELAGLTAYSAFHLRPGVEIDSSAVTGNNLTLSGDINLAGYRYGPGANPAVYGSGEPGTLVLRASGNLNVLGSITDGFGKAQSTPDDNGWTIHSGTTLTNSATTTQAVTLGVGTTIPVGSGTKLTYDVMIAGEAIAANVPISIAVTTAADFVLPASWTTTADIQPPSGPVIPKGTILPAGFTIPAGSVLNAGTMLPQQVAITAMTVPAGTPLNMFANRLTLVSTASLKAGDTIPSGTTVSLPGLASGTVNTAITLTAPATLAAGSTLATEDNFGNPISFDAALTITNAFLQKNQVLPFGFTSAASVTITNMVLPSQITEPNGTILAAGTRVSATLPAGTIFGPNFDFKTGARPEAASATIPANTPLPTYINGATVTLAASATLQIGDTIWGGSNIIVTSSPSVALRATDSNGDQGQIWAAAALLPAGTQSWSLRLASGADLGAADTRTLLPAATLNGSGNLTLDDLHYGDGESLDLPSFSVLRTGTGDLDLLAGGNFNEATLFGVYTAGAQSAASLTSGSNLYNLPRGTTNATTYAPGVSSLYQANYPEDGGDVFISVQGNLSQDLQTDGVGGSIFPDSAAVGDWLWRQGGGIVGQPAAWWINFGTYVETGHHLAVLTGFTGIGTLGGGNVSVLVGGKAGLTSGAATDGLDIVVASTGRVTDDASQPLKETGGGDLTLKVGGAINGISSNPGSLSNDMTGTLVDLRGDTFVEAASVGYIGPGYGSSDIYDPRSADPRTAEAAGAAAGLDVIPGDGTVTIDTRGNLVLDGVGDAGRVGQQNSTPYSATVNGVTTTAANGGNSWFTLWTASTAVNLFSAGGNLTPSLQNQDNGGNATAGGNDGTTDLGRVLYPGSLSVVAAEGNIYFVNSAGTISGSPLELAPSAVGQLNVLAGGSIYGNGNIIDMSGADPSVLATPLQPAFRNTAGNVSNLSPNGYPDAGTGYGGMLFAFGADTATTDLHQSDAEPIHVYADTGDIVDLQVGEILTWPAGSGKTPLTWYIGAKPVWMIAGRDIVSSGTPLDLTPFSATSTTANLVRTEGNFFLDLNASDISMVQAGRDIIYSSFAIAGPGLLDVQAGRNFYAGDRGSLTSVGPIIDVSQQTSDSGAAVTLAAGVGKNGPDWTDFANLYLNLANLADPSLPLDAQPGKVIQDPQTVTSLADLYTWLRVDAGYKGDQTGALAFFNALPEAQRATYPSNPLLYAWLKDQGYTGSQGDALAYFLGLGAAQQTAFTYNAMMYAWLQTRFGYTGNQAGALATFDALPIVQQAVYDRIVYFDELTAAGREETGALASPRLGSYLRGRDAIAALFPSQDASGHPITYSGSITLFSGDVTINSYTGRIDMTLEGGDMLAQSDSGINTEFGGGIDILTPGGATTLGANGIIPGASAGAVTQGSGSIDIYSLESILLGQARVMTTFGGDILAWSAEGDINAGRGSKTTVVYSPPRRLYDKYGNVTLSPTVPSTGAGIATLNPIPGVPPGDIDLIAPLGTVDAGEAGIRVSGNFNVAALQVVNTANIQVQGTVTGINTVAAPNIGALDSASSAAGAATKAIASPAQNTSNAQPSILIVEIEGYGGDDTTAPVQQPQPERKKPDIHAGQDDNYDPDSTFRVIGSGNLTDEQKKKLTDEERKNL
ncbi:MAG: filamentous hemagglutinin family protein [Pseudomonadota bacterium]